MKKIYLTIAIALLVLTSSCNSFLDVTPAQLTQKTFYKTENDLKSALVGAYAPLNYEHFYGNFYPLYLAGGDDLSFYQRATSNNPSTSILLGNANSSTAEIATFWKALYEGINRANLIIENINNNGELSQELRNNVKAEAKFLRGFYYFNLVQGWGDVPLIDKALKQIDASMFKGRTPKNVVYDFLIKDIEESIEFLPSIVGLGHTGTITQTAAQGMLARVYLFRAGEHLRDNTAEPTEVKSYYEAAKKWALLVKESGIHDLAPSYEKVFIDLSEDKYNSQGVYESMWEAEMFGNREGEIQAAGRIGNTLGFGSKVDFSQMDGVKENSGMKNPGYSYRFIYGSLKLYRMYEEEKDTERGNWNIAPFEYTISDKDPKTVVGRTYYFGKKPASLTEVEGMPCIELGEKDFKGYPDSQYKTRCAAKYRREYEKVLPKSKNFTPINFPILRYSDVLLMLAEADNYLNGPTELAYECINKVRTRAKVKVLEGLSQADFLQAIKKERAMELCFEATRRWDLIRWGDFYKYMKDMKNYVNDKEWNPAHNYAASFYNITPSYTYFPIPDLEIGANPLPQNPGW